MAKGNPHPKPNIGNKGNTSSKKNIVLEKEHRKKNLIDLNDKLKEFMEHALVWAIKVIKDEDRVMVTKHLKLGGTQTFEQDRYTAETKIELIKKFADKTFSDKKDITLGGDPLAPVPVSFNFKPAPKRKL